MTKNTSLDQKEQEIENPRVFSILESYFKTHSLSRMQIESL